MGNVSSQQRDPGCLDTYELAAFVEGRLAGEAQARAAAHVEGCLSCGTRAAQAHSQSAAAAASGARDKSAALPPQLSKALGMPNLGDVIADKYVVEEAIGRGGMGAVFAARHRELGHRVALKVLFRAEPDAVARFLREAQTCARLTSDHLVRVYDVGRLESGAPYLVMEFLTGRDLAAVLQAGPVAIQDAVSWLLQACAGLGEAHAAGVVHRDLKPANLFLIERKGGSSLVKVLDFGVSKLLHRDVLDGDLSLTNEEAMVGSPLFMSPEQIKDSKDVDQRTDIWSLGIILYQLLAGKHPFAAKSISALSVAIAMENPPPPSSIRPEVPPGLDAVVMRCLEKDRERRFASLRELSEALSPFAASGARPFAGFPSSGTRAAPMPTSPLASTHPTGPAPAMALTQNPTPAVLAQAFRPPQQRTMAPIFVAVAVLLAAGAGAGFFLVKRGKPADTTSTAASTTATTAPSAPAATATAPPASTTASAATSAQPSASTSAAAAAADPAPAKPSKPTHRPSPPVPGKPSTPKPPGLPGPTDTPD